MATSEDMVKMLMEEENKDWILENLGKAVGDCHKKMGANEKEMLEHVWAGFMHKMGYKVRKGTPDWVKKL